MFLDEEDFNGILNCLPKFRQLVELKLHLSYDGVDCVDLDEIFSPNRDLLTALAEELPLLECFHIQFCDISAETLIDFIRRAKKLKTVKVYRCGLEVSDLILETIDNVRKAESLGSMVLCADKISSELNREVQIDFLCNNHYFFCNFTFFRSRNPTVTWVFTAYKSRFMVSIFVYEKLLYILLENI